MSDFSYYSIYVYTISQEVQVLKELLVALETLVSQEGQDKREIMVHEVSEAELEPKE